MRRGLRPPLAVFTAAVCLAFVVELSPHLVHHLDDHQAHTECPFATVSERTHGDLPAAVTLPAGDGRPAAVAPAPAEAAPARPARLSTARSPPPIAS